MNESYAAKVAEAGTEDWLSSLIDGELDVDSGRRDVIALVDDEASRERWAEYALIGDALRGQAFDSGKTMARFRAALAEEPTVLAPMPKKRGMAPSFLWLAAAAAVAGITWTVMSTSPDTSPSVPIAMSTIKADPELTAEVQPYLAAHQDFANAVLSTPEMHITRVSLSELSR